ncbi:hypothetical protein H9Q72_001885 [Fusarium xylarioides]|uniref:FAD-binding FR-type domain-containing protein n=1 Tax=Fusarium xylarioides TaxID=221167 RepID=A0A9P7LB80_9HYPO|nr:hypothetical protein H9Q70_012086 [Fusarium xylarioides]KAG5771713.1 hypothetical protein H9Q72_001885 [Fusarium xylarioides]KAG5774164.1 hypothetical protein H9Q73_011801 [Fusarium xylarioides]KAG5804389.1 hypothetical protein H9Q71_011021 [Fusarium xylarioides]KAG5812937.1 hypothetical protein H9Q74_012902 [Fusarium xylarioides]
MTVNGTNGDSPPLGELKHISLTRLTPSLSIHTFSILTSHEFSRSFRPSQHLTLQFPPDLDPVSGPQNLSDQERCLSFTPFHLQYAEDGTIESISLMARNGRVTGLLGLPRPHGPLVAKIVEVGGGFPSEILEQTGQPLCIAGGTGIAPFIAMAAAKNCNSSINDLKPSLICSIRGDDFGVIEYLWNHEMLYSRDWNAIRIFVTPGEETGGTAAGKSQSWWHQRFKELLHDHNDSDIFRLGRMETKDLEEFTKDTDGPVLFCGSKQLEWQVKMWFLGKKNIHGTER